MYIKSAFLAAALAVSSSVFAQDAANFSGPRIEARLGVDSVKSKYSETFTFDFTDPAFPTETDSFGARDNASGAFYGVGIGYDIAIRNFVIGAEANIDFSSVEQESDLFELDDEYVKAGRDIELSARAGLLIASNTLFYVKGGYVNGRVKVVGEDEDDERVSEGRNLDGWRLGAGAETAISASTYLKFEYNYTDYENLKDSESETFAGAGTATEAYNLGFSRHKAVIAVGYRF